MEPLDLKDDPAGAATPPPEENASLQAGVRGSPLLAVLCLVSVAAADVLFWKQPFGWTLGAYGLFLLATIFASAGRLPRGTPAIVITLALLLLLISSLEEPNQLATFLAILGLLTFALVSREGWTAQSPVWIRRWLRFLVAGWLCLFKDVRAWRRARIAECAARGRGWGFLRNWSLAVVLGVVFIALFSAANPVISDWLADAWKALPDLFEKFPPAARILMWIFVAVAVWALLRYRSGIDGTPPVVSPKPPEPVKDPLSVGVIVRCLLLFNVIFAVQTVLDVCYLYGGAQLPEGMTYARYAHRGAYPLVATALLAAAFVLVAFRAGVQPDRMRLARRLVYAWLAQNVFLVFSAAWRLRLYVNVYTLTRWRVAAALWMLLVALGLVWILRRIIYGRSNLWLVNANTLSAVVILYACAFLNFDGFIARFNVTHCAEVSGEGPDIDLEYLEGLGPETLPALHWLADNVEDPEKAERVRSTAARLASNLRADLDNWRAWTFRRQRLARLPIPDPAPLLPESAYASRPDVPPSH